MLAYASFGDPMDLKKTPLNSLEHELGGKMIDFGGWELPVQFTGILDEHEAVRTKAGLFDVSHMGEITVKGPDALPLLQRATCNDVAKLEDGCAQLALQGPNAQRILQPLVDVDLAPIKYYRFTRGKVDGVDALISRTGYTGEDGFELYVAPAESQRLFRKLIDAGEVKPCGLGARDTLRLEAKMALYGNDIDETTTPLEADLGWIVKIDKGDFYGRDVLQRENAEGPKRKLVGFEMVDRGIARHGYPIVDGKEEIGVVTSGTQSPTLKKPIGLAYLPLEKSAPGTEFMVLIRGRETRARVVPTPFYKRAK